jgi:hypothetical protein
VRMNGSKGNVDRCTPRKNLRQLRTNFVSFPTHKSLLHYRLTRPLHPRLPRTTLTIDYVGIAPVIAEHDASAK